MNFLSLLKCAAIVAIGGTYGCSDDAGVDPSIQATQDSIQRVQDSIAYADSVAFELEKLTARYQMANPGPWVDSVMGTLSDEDKIAQLFVVAVYPYRESSTEKMNALLAQHKIGGIITMKGGPVATAKRINAYQSMSEVPLLVCTDAEWGVKMRMDSVVRFPYQLTLGAMESDSLVYAMGALIARQHKRLGIHVNFAPVIDVNNNPDNPVIGMRSFGEDKENVATKGWAYSKALQDNNVLAIGKHWPGHGDTDVDSHLDLPVIRHDMARLHDIEFYPFKQLINNGLGGIMTTHLYIPAIDSTPNLAAGLSEKAVSGLLREELGFDGLVFTDALNMSGVTKHWKNGETDVRALIAGNDIMLMSPDIYTSIAAVQQAVKDSVITMEMIEQKVRKILAVKKWAGLDNYQPTKIEGLLNDLNNAESDAVNQDIAEAASTLLYNQDFFPLPLDSGRLDSGKTICVVSIGGSSNSSFIRELKAQGIEFKHYYVSGSTNATKLKTTLARAKGYDVCLVDVHANGFRPKNNYGVNKNMLDNIRIMGNQHPNAALFLFTDGYALRRMTGLDKYKAVAVFYQNTKETNIAGARLVAGTFKPSGKFPVTLNDNLKVGMRAE